jgi:hypothetical protein
MATKVAILSGVKVGQTVITEGADNLEDGSQGDAAGRQAALPGSVRRRAGCSRWLFGGSKGEGRDGAIRCAGRRRQCITGGQGNRSGITGKASAGKRGSRPPAASDASRA